MCGAPLGASLMPHHRSVTSAKALHVSSELSGTRKSSGRPSDKVDLGQDPITQKGLRLNLISLRVRVSLSVGGWVVLVGVKSN